MNISHALTETERGLLLSLLSIYRNGELSAKEAELIEAIQLATVIVLR